MEEILEMMPGVKLGGQFSHLTSEIRGRLNEIVDERNGNKTGNE